MWLTEETTAVIPWKHVQTDSIADLSLFEGKSVQVDLTQRGSELIGTGTASEKKIIHVKEILPEGIRAWERSGIATSLIPWSFIRRDSLVEESALN